MWIPYLIAIVVANLLTAALAASFPLIIAINAFFLIGLDLALRDSLHEHWRGRDLAPRMALLIAAGGLLSYALNADAAAVAIGSSVAFSLATLGDTIVYHVLRTRPYLLRANASNIAGAAIDSVIFPLIALSFLPTSVLLATMAVQFLAKTGGGALWSLALRPWAKI